MASTALLREAWDKNWFSEGGALLAGVNRGPPASDGAGGAMANLWEAASRSLSAHLQVDDAWAIALAADGTLAAIGGLNGEIVV